MIEPEEVAEKAGYTRPHTVHCGPEGIYVAALGNREGKGPGGIFLMDHETFEVRGQWEMDRGPQHFAYDAWWHLGHDTLVTSEWGTPDTFENGLIPEMLLGAKYGRRLHFWDLHKRKHLQTIDFGDKYQLVFELRPAHDPTKAYGFVNCVISLENLSSSIWTWYKDGDKWAVKKVIEIPAEPATEDQLPPLLKGFKAVPPLVTDIDLSMDDKYLYVACWGTGDLQQYDVSDPFNPKLTGKVRIGGIVSRATHPGAKNGALSGGPQMVEISRDGKRVYFTNSLYGAIDPQFYPDGIEGWMVKLDAKPAGRHRLRREVLRQVAGAAPPAPGAAGGRRLLVGLLLLSVGARTVTHIAGCESPPCMETHHGNAQVHHRKGHSQGRHARSGAAERRRRQIQRGARPARPRIQWVESYRRGRQDVLRLPRQGRGCDPQACGDQRLSGDQDHRDRQDDRPDHGGAVRPPAGAAGRVHRGVGQAMSMFPPRSGRGWRLPGRGVPRPQPGHGLAVRRGARLHRQSRTS